MPEEDELAAIREVPWKRADTRLLAVAVAPILAMGAVFAAFWSSIPERVPMHFGVSGAPDAWASKAFVALVPPAVAVAQTALLGAVARWPQAANLPVEVTASNFRHVYALTRRAVLLVALVLNAVVAGLAAITALTGVETGVSRLIPIASGLAFGSVVGIVVWLTRRLRAVASATQGSLEADVE